MRYRSILLASLLLAFGASLLPGRADDLDDAMQGYLNAVLVGDTYAFASNFSHQKPWRFVSYRAGTSHIMSNDPYTYDETQHLLDKKGGFYSAFFGGTAQYRYRDRISSHPLTTWVRDGTIYRIPEKDGISFVRWRKEGPNWVIESIGDDAP